MRLTDRNYKNTTLALNSCKPYLKLGELEDTEEKFGIDFITFYEAITNGVWIKDETGQIYHTNVYLHNLVLTPDSYEIKIGLLCFITPNNELLSFSRIKQDWALTREELENGKHR